MRRLEQHSRRWFITAHAIVVATGDRRQFDSARDFAA
jgi:hypothetical protein